MTSSVEGTHRIAFVADDLGISAGANEGIARLAESGLVREASLCVTGSAVSAGVVMARETGLGVGLHLCFTLGRALRGPIRGLTDREGNFRGLRAVLTACFLRRIDRAAAAREIEAQLDRLGEFDIEPSHLNGHHHVHCFPVLREIAFDVAAHRGLAWTRLPLEHGSIAGRWQPARRLLAHFSRGCVPLLAPRGMRALPFVGLSMEGRVDFARRFEAARVRLPPGDYEWMVHPRVPDDEFARLDPGARNRDGAARAELAALLDLARHGITDPESKLRPVAFRDLA